MGVHDICYVCMYYIPLLIQLPYPSAWHAFKFQKLDLISVLQSKKGRRDKFKELLNRLVQGDANVNARGEHGNTALHHAVLVSYISLLQACHRVT